MIKCKIITYADFMGDRFWFSNQILHDNGGNQRWETLWNNFRYWVTPLADIGPHFMRFPTIICKGTFGNDWHGDNMDICAVWNGSQIGQTFTGVRTDWLGPHVGIKVRKVTVTGRHGHMNAMGCVFRSDLENPAADYWQLKRTWVHRHNLEVVAATNLGGQNTPVIVSRTINGMPDMGFAQVTDYKENGVVWHRSRQKRRLRQMGQGAGAKTATFELLTIIARTVEHWNAYGLWGGGQIHNDGYGFYQSQLNMMAVKAGGLKDYFDETYGSRVRNSSRDTKGENAYNAMKVKANSLYELIQAHYQAVSDAIIPAPSPYIPAISWRGFSSSVFQYTHFADELNDYTFPDLALNSDDYKDRIEDADSSEGNDQRFELSPNRNLIIV